jgi:hypothetical protein
MNCQHCGWPIKEGEMACRACLWKANLDAALRAQRYYLDSVSAGDLELYIVRRHRGASGGHIALFGHRHAAYCGEQLSDDVFHRKERARLADLVRVSLCGDCLKVLDGLIARAHAALPAHE